MKNLQKILVFLLSLMLTLSMVACMVDDGAPSSSEKHSSEKTSVGKISFDDLFSEESSEEEFSVEESLEEQSSEEESLEEQSSEEESIEESASEVDSESEEESESEKESESESSSEEEEAPEYEINKPLNDATSSKRIVKTKYSTDSVIVADVIVTDFGADRTGKRDSTRAIQAAVDRASALGGGTVFLPVGKYLVSSTIIVHDYVTLVGDWNKPDPENTDENFDYGTVILASPQTLGSMKPQDRSLFHMGSCSGIVGVTFYYVGQDAVNVKKYGYTIYANGPATATFKNLTFINSAYGIGVSLNTIANELVNLENIYGTFLYNAVAHNATSDVGFYDNINVSPKYWQNASAEYKCSNADSLNTFVNDNLTAMVLGDLDDQLISNVTIDGGKMGIKFTTGIRENAGFWGVVYKANITCEKGVYADFLNDVSGVVFADSNVGVVENNSAGCIKMSNSTYQGTGSGRVLQEGGEITKNVAISPLSLSFSSSQRLFIANNLTAGGVEDNSSKLQSILDSVGEEGGIVLVPNGIYRLNSSVTVPNNVELRSSQSIFSRSRHKRSNDDDNYDKNGVVFISYVSGATFVLNENAGAVGIRIWHPKNDYITAYNALQSGVIPSDTSIKGVGAGAYAYMCESVGAYVGYDFSNCDNHVLKSNYGISYFNFIKAGGKNGVINQCLANPNFMTRTSYHQYFDSSLSNISNWEKLANSGEVNDDFFFFRDEVGRTYTKMVRLENAENEIAFGVFAFGEAGLFDMVNSTATLINTSLDYIKSTNIVYELSGGTCDIVGSLRVFGTSIKVNSGRLTAYGRIAFGEVKEKAYDSDVSLEDKIDYVSENAKKMTLFNCNYTKSGFNVDINYNSKYAIEGTSWKWKTTTLEGSFASKDISEYANGYLHFYVYCSDISKMGTGQIEITSSGTCDVNECGWDVAQYITKTGWNEIWLDLSSGAATGGKIDLSNVNYMRIYILNSSATFYIDSIEVVTD